MEGESPETDKTFDPAKLIQLLMSGLEATSSIVYDHSPEEDHSSVSIIGSVLLQVNLYTITPEVPLQKHALRRS